MTTETASPAGTDGTFPLSTYRAASEAHLIPEWLSISAHCGLGDEGLECAFEALTERLHVYGDLLYAHDGDAPVDWTTVGVMLMDMARDAERFLKACKQARRDARRAAEAEQQAAAPEADIEALRKRFTQRMIDAFPMDLSMAMHGAMCAALDRNWDDLDKHITRLEQATFPGWSTPEAGRLPRNPQPAEQRNDGVERVGSDGLTYFDDRTNALLERCRRLFSRTFPEALAEEFDSLVFYTAQRDWAQAEEALTKLEANTVATGPRGAS